MSDKLKKLNILIEIGHPAHIHFFKNIIKIWENRGHNIFIVSRDKDITNQLLKEMGYNFISLTKQQTNKFLMLIELLIRWIKIYIFIIKKKIDIVISISGISTAVPGKLAGITTVTCTDTEDAVLSNKIAFKFSDVILVPQSFLLKDKYKKIVAYNGYHELAYLHPNHFKPKKTNLRFYNITNKKKYIIIRLIKWKALHDINESGINNENLKKLINFIEVRKIRPIISSERELPAYFRKYLINKHYSKIFDLISFSYGYIGESPTMAVESALLGKPSVLINSRVDVLGNMIELEKKYNLLYNFKNFNNAFRFIKTNFFTLQIKKVVNKNRAKLLKEKIDVSKWVADFVLKFYKQKKKRD